MGCGRGACDTKGCVAAMLSALCALAQSRQRPAETEIVFVGLVDEENAQAGSRTLAASGFRADLAIVGEPREVCRHHGKGVCLVGNAREREADRPVHGVSIGDGRAPGRACPGLISGVAASARPVPPPAMLSE